MSSDLPVLPTGIFVVRFDLDTGKQKGEGEPVAVWVAALEDSAGQLGQGDTGYADRLFSDFVFESADDGLFGLPAASTYLDKWPAVRFA